MNELVTTDGMVAFAIAETSKISSEDTDPSDEEYDDNVENDLPAVLPPLATFGAATGGQQAHPNPFHIQPIWNHGQLLLNYTGGDATQCFIANTCT